MYKYEAVIFDLDGVICKTDKYHYLAWKHIADELNIEFNQEINKRLLGVSRMESFDIILEKYQGQMTDKEKIKWTDQKNEYYRSMLSQMSPDDILPGVKEVMESLRCDGIKLGLGSSSKNAKYILHQIQLDDYFDAVCDGNDITHSKPNPEVFVKTAQLLQCEASRCLVVEDAIAGIEAAHAGGMDCAAVGSIAISSLKAEYNIHAFSDLLAVFRK